MYHFSTVIFSCDIVPHGNDCLVLLPVDVYICVIISVSVSHQRCRQRGGAGRDRGWWRGLGRWYPAASADVAVESFHQTRRQRLLRLLGGRGRYGHWLNSYIYIIGRCTMQTRLYSTYRRCYCMTVMHWPPHCCRRWDRLHFEHSI